MNVSGNTVAPDTTAAIAVLGGDREALAVLRRFETLLLPVPALGELLYGALNSGRADDNVRAVTRLADRCRVLPVDDQVAAVYGRVRVGLKKRGRPIPENDVWIAAVCIRHGLPLAAREAHFEHVQDLQRINIQRGARSRLANMADLAGPRLHRKDLTPRLLCG